MDEPPASTVPSRRGHGGGGGRQRGPSATAVGGGRGAGERPDRLGFTGETGIDVGIGGRAAAADGAEAAGFGRGGAEYSGGPGEIVPQPRGDGGSGGEAAGEVAEGVRPYPRRAGAAGEAMRPSATPGAASRTAAPAGPLQGAHLPGERPRDQPLRPPHPLAQAPGPTELAPKLEAANLSPFPLTPNQTWGKSHFLFLANLGKELTLTNSS